MPTKVWPSRYAWCGRDVSNEHHFTDLDHAAYAVGQESYQQPCQDCVKAAMKVLNGDNVLLPPGGLTWPIDPEAR